MSRSPRGMAREPLLKLASLAGISTEYYDIKGELQRPSVRALMNILSSMGHSDVEGALKELKTRPFNRFLEPCMAVFEDEQPITVSLYIPCPEGGENEVSVSISVAAEDGAELETRTINGVALAEEATHRGRRYIRFDTVLDIQRDCGYYNIMASSSCPSGELRGTMLLIIAPRRCHMPAKRTWGITLSLYSVRSSRNWGIGDLGDLRAIMKAAGTLGAGFVGINPLHAIPGSLKLGICPYQPISRLYRNHIYVDPAELPPVPHDDSSATPGDLRAAQLVDYDNVAALKLKALRKSFEEFISGSDASGDREEFKRYCQMEGPELEEFATYMALAKHLEESGALKEPGKGWQSWPPEYHDPGSPEVADFRDKHANDVTFYQYVQWMLNRQLERLGEASRGMDIGLYGDLAVGSSSGGSDAWIFGDVFAPDMNMGAPPDDFSPFGQNWLFPPLVPEKLRESGYSLFIQTLRKSMQHFDALRIDHALGLFRAFWIPEGMGADEGTYVTYPYDEMLKIIALESIRSSTVIIAEDLGTVGQNVRQALSAYGMLSYRLLYFQRDWEKETFLPPEAYPTEALAAVNTHDLPTMLGFRDASDIRLRNALGLYLDTEAFEAAMELRGREKNALMNALGPYMPAGNGKAEDDDSLIIAAHTLISRSPSLLAAMSLDDALGLREQQNLPGVEGGHPNWRRKYPLELEDIFGPDSRAKLLDALANIFRKARN